jgi:hypothetical protein
MASAAAIERVVKKYLPEGVDPVSLLKVPTDEIIHAVDAQDRLAILLFLTDLREARGDASDVDAENKSDGEERVRDEEELNPFVEKNDKALRPWLRSVLAKAATSPSTEEYAAGLASGNVLGQDARCSIERLVLTELNLFDADLPHVLTMAKCLPNCTQVDLRFNQLNDPAKALDPLRAVLSLSQDMVVDITANPIAFVEGKMLYRRLHLSELAKLIWIPREALGLRGWHVFFDDQDADKQKKIEAVRHAHLEHFSHTRLRRRMTDTLQQLGLWPVTEQNARAAARALAERYTLPSLASVLDSADESYLFMFIRHGRREAYARKLVKAFRKDKAAAPSSAAGGAPAVAASASASSASTAALSPADAHSGSDASNTG